jgi:hypothetical protein
MMSEEGTCSHARAHRDAGTRWGHRDGARRPRCSPRWAWSRSSCLQVGARRSPARPLGAHEPRQAGAADQSRLHTTRQRPPSRNRAAARSPPTARSPAPGATPPPPAPRAAPASAPSARAETLADDAYVALQGSGPVTYAALAPGGVLANDAGVGAGWGAVVAADLGTGGCGGGRDGGERAGRRRASACPAARSRAGRERRWADAARPAPRCGAARARRPRGPACRRRAPLASSSGAAGEPRLEARARPSRGAGGGAQRDAPTRSPSRPQTQHHRAHQPGGQRRPDLHAAERRCAAFSGRAAT